MAARNRLYYDAVAAGAYHHGVALHQYAHLVTRSHTRRPAYEPARDQWEPEALIRADLAIAEGRA